MESMETLSTRPPRSVGCKSRLGPGEASAYLRPALPVILCALLWETVSRLGWLDSLFFPAPSVLLASALQMIREGELLFPVLVTLKKTMAGFALGSSAGVICGMLMGASASVRRSFAPVISAVYTVPKLSLLPILMLFFGIGDTAGILLIAVGCFIILALQIGDAVRNLSPVYVEMAAVYGASRTALFRTVYLPASMPSLFTGLRLALGRALMIAVAVEMISSGDGLGGMVWFAWQVFAVERLYVGVFIAGLLGFLFHHALRLIESRAVPWSEGNGSW
jgi:ABC-type nitrate/sulfonate/bicarbonate transport system permease component